MISLFKIAPKHTAAMLSNAPPAQVAYDASHRNNIYVLGKLYSGMSYSVGGYKSIVNKSAL